MNIINIVKAWFVKPTIELCPVCGEWNDNLPRPVCQNCTWDMEQEVQAVQEPTEMERFLDRNPCLSEVDYNALFRLATHSEMLQFEASRDGVDYGMDRDYD